MLVISSQIAYFRLPHIHHLYITAMIQRFLILTIGSTVALGIIGSGTNGTTLAGQARQATGRASEGFFVRGLSGKIFWTGPRRPGRLERRALSCCSRNR